MNTYVVHGRRPASLFAFFEEISAIPRASYHEAAVADYLVAFAQARGLEVHRDAFHNVLIKAPASRGMEDRPALLLQGHTDMVCEKNSDTVHDFSKDPLQLYVEGRYLRAKGTTLGADDGVAVALMLALLDGAIAVHPAYECLFTTAEEVGLNGAIGFDYSLLRARRMLNLDSEELGVVTVGCAGGVRSDLTLAYTPVPFEGEGVRVHISGLMGGHSGENINSGRANAIKLMGRMLAELMREIPDVRLVSLVGGSKDNAIPRECEAVLATAQPDATVDALTECAARIAEELHTDDHGFQCTCESAEHEAVMLSSADTARAVAVLSCAACGVLAMSTKVKGLVEYSRNLGVVTSEDDALHFVFSSRSALESRLDATMAELEALARVTGCSIRHHGRYPGWADAAVSPLRDAYLRAYREVTGEEARVNVIHAGLECGIIYSKVPDMDMISIGPTMQNIHSPDEALDLDSTEVFWDTLVRLIESM